MEFPGRNVYGENVGVAPFVAGFPPKESLHQTNKPLIEVVFAMEMYYCLQM